jgi:hypothetical protein
VNRIDISWRGVSVVILASLCTVIALSHGVLSIDVARDLYQAQLIRDQTSFPAAGPPINGATVLGPIWYYALAAATWLGGSLSLASALVGVALSLKYVFAYIAGSIWRDETFALLLVVAMTMPGVASYALLGVAHPSFVETFLWAAALFALLAVRSKKNVPWFGLVGLASALALHAHPTAILVVAPVAVLLLVWRWRLGGRQQSAMAALWFLAGFTVPFLPLVLAFEPSQATAMADTVKAAAHAWPSVLVIVKNALWHQPQLFAYSYGITELIGKRTWQIVWCAVLVTIAAGAVLGVYRPRSRRSLLIAAGSLGAVIILVGLLRRVTPFYMFYVALPALSVVIALSWQSLLKSRYRAVVVAACACVLLLQILLAFGVTQSSARGLLDSRLPFESNLQNVSRERRLQPVVSTYTRDAFARWLCTQGDTVVIHGSLAASLDLGLGVELPLVCRDQHARIGTTLKVAGQALGAAHWIGLPREVWRNLVLEPVVDLYGAALGKVSAVHSPQNALATADGNRYPPRLEAMLAALNAEPWQIEFKSAASEYVSVAALIPLLSNWHVEAKANGITVNSAQEFGSNVLFRCETCDHSAPVVWRIRVTGATADVTSIVSFSATLLK